MATSTHSDEFAALLRMLKSRSRRSYAELSQHAGVGRSTLHRYCTGTKVPRDFTAIHRFAVACGATPREVRELHQLWALAEAGEHGPTGEREPEVSTPDDPSAGEAAVAGPSTPIDPSASNPPGADTAPPCLIDLSACVTAMGDQPPTDTSTQRPPGQGRRPRLPRWWPVAAVVVATALLSGAAFKLFPTAAPAAPATGASSTGTPPPLLFTPPCRDSTKVGQQGDCVYEVQRLLALAGARLAVDRIFGPETLRRVTAFQVLAGLPPHGVVDDATKYALYARKALMTTWSQVQAERRIREVFRAHPDRAVAIADCQSYLDPLYVLSNSATTGTWGLFQLSGLRIKELGGTLRDALNPEWNIQAAYRLSDGGQDFSHWDCDRAFRVAATPRK